MKALLSISILIVLLFAAPCQCRADIGVETVTKERAEKEWGATLRTQVVGTNQVGVWLEFKPTGKLKTFSSVKLDIADRGRTIVSATLSPTKQTSDAVVVYFTTDPAYLRSSSLTVLYRIDNGFPPYDGIRFSVRDFVKHDPTP